ncbi:lysoplasmalogenase family protein [Flavobacterium sp. H122]|uniref:lysoplasmalogenase family protein n=1 Tax=Flavobacterium sp. H122 TaxID=2529860 RepID=UPI0010AA40FB|nr:lysoplasmalogenase family protein [Flavobacterium sp. H122]
MNELSLSIKLKLEEKAFLILFFGIGIVEIFAEFFSETIMVYFLKPLLMPILAVTYWRVSKERNKYFLMALFFVLLANIFFISKEYISIVIASSFFFIYRGLVIYIVLCKDPVKNYLPVFLGSLPFLTAFGYLTYLTEDELGSGFYIFLFQIFFLSFLGGLAVSNYIMNDSRKNFWLLLNAVLFAVIQFIIVLKNFYLSIQLFQPVSMLMYLFAQYGLYRYMIISETEKK